ncbi:MAG: alpha/beta hydrolase [Leptolyngbyaceae cyanobacterium bins.302]|nr:alpha/beta hydrolase [Leptolyngbyaceae cyanobacterium bins.302]
MLLTLLLSGITLNGIAWMQARSMTHYIKAGERTAKPEKVSPAAVILESPFDRLLSTVRHRFEAMGIPSFPGAELIVGWGGIQQGIDGFAHNPIDYAKAIKCPVLLMYGTSDQRVTSQEIQSIFDTLPGRKQLVVFSAIGHGSLASDAPSKWKQSVQQFLTKSITK